MWHHGRLQEGPIPKPIPCVVPRLVPQGAGGVPSKILAHVARRDGGTENILNREKHRIIRNLILFADFNFRSPGF